MSETLIYRPSPAVGECLCHGEILSNLVRVRVDPATIGNTEQSNVRVTYAYAIVLSQSCDLMQDYAGRQKEQPQLPDILCCQVRTAEEMRSECGGSDIWKRIRQNKDERYHFLEKAPTNEDALGNGLPELGIDFKRYFTLPTEEMYAGLIAGTTKRRTVLLTPYLEHLATRFSYFMGRVALPRDHVSE